MTPPKRDFAPQSLPNVASLQQAHLLVLVAYQRRVAAALNDPTTVAGTPAFADVTRGLRLLGNAIERLPRWLPEELQASEEKAIADKLADEFKGLRLRLKTFDSPQPTGPLNNAHAS